MDDPTVRQENGEAAPSGSVKLFDVLRTLDRRFDFLVTWTGYLSGGLFVVMALFITYDVLARKWGIHVGLPTTRVTDELSGYLLVLAATWGFAYTLKAEGHVRIDVLLPYMSRGLRAGVDLMAMVLMALFAGILSWKIWDLVVDSLKSGIKSSTYLLTPLYIPQGILGVGFTLLTLTAVVAILSMVAEWISPAGHGESPSRQAAEPGRTGSADTSTSGEHPSLRSQ